MTQKLPLDGAQAGADVPTPDGTDSGTVGPMQTESGTA